MVGEKQRNPNKEMISDPGFQGLQCNSQGPWEVVVGINVPIDVRRVLGYHSTPGDRTTLVHSRDGMAGPLCHLQDTIDEVSAGTFRPDLTQSGYHVAAGGDGVVAGSNAARFLQLAGETRETDKDDSTSEELDSESSSEASADEEFGEHDLELSANAENEVVPAWNQLETDVYGDVVDAKLVRHRRSTMYHLVADEAGTHLMWQGHHNQFRFGSR